VCILLFRTNIAQNSVGLVCAMNCPVFWRDIESSIRACPWLSGSDVESLKQKYSLLINWDPPPEPAPIVDEWDPTDYDGTGGSPTKKMRRDQAAEVHHAEMSF